MTNEQSISVLVTAARIAQSKGAFTLEEASVINEAIKTFNKPVETPKEEVKEEKEEKEVEPIDKVK